MGTEVAAFAHTNDPDLSAIGTALKTGLEIFPRGNRLAPAKHDRNPREPPPAECLTSI